MFGPMRQKVLLVAVLASLPAFAQPVVNFEPEVSCSSSRATGLFRGRVTFSCQTNYGCSESFLLPVPRCKGSEDFPVFEDAEAELVGFELTRFSGTGFELGELALGIYKTSFDPVQREITLRVFAVFPAPNADFQRFDATVDFEVLLTDNTRSSIIRTSHFCDQSSLGLCCDANAGECAYKFQSSIQSGWTYAGGALNGLVWRDPSYAPRNDLSFMLSEDVASATTEGYCRAPSGSSYTPLECGWSVVGLQGEPSELLYSAKVNGTAASTSPSTTLQYFALSPALFTRCGLKGFSFYSVNGPVMTATLRSSRACIPIPAWSIFGYQTTAFWGMDPQDYFTSGSWAVWAG